MARYNSMINSSFRREIISKIYRMKGCSQKRVKSAMLQDRALIIRPSLFSVIKVMYNELFILPNHFCLSAKSFSFNKNHVIIIQWYLDKTETDHRNSDYMFEFSRDGVSILIEFPNVDSIIVSSFNSYIQQV